MSSNLDFSKVIQISEMEGEDQEETLLLEQMAKEAKAFLESFTWCVGISEAWFGLGVGGVVAVFLFKILPKSDEVDEFLWVIVGDLPPAYLVTDVAPNPACALKAYILEMNEWISAVKSGQPIADLIPVNASPTVENAQNLEGRLSFIWKEILSPYYGDDLETCSETSES